MKLPKVKMLKVYVFSCFRTTSENMHYNAFQFMLPGVCFQLFTTKSILLEECTAIEHSKAYTLSIVMHVFDEAYTKKHFRKKLKN